MGKFAKKPPTTVRSVVGTGKTHAEAWYSKPVCLGRLDLRNAYWYTQDGKRFISSRDAMDYLITMHEKVGPGSVVPPEARAVPVTIEEEIEEEKKAAPARKAKPAPVKVHKGPTKNVPFVPKMAPDAQDAAPSPSPNLESMLSDLLKQQPNLLAKLMKEANQKKG